MDSNDAEAHVESDDLEALTCPFCKEQIRPDASKCKHCGSHLEPQGPSHGGTCPFCKEQINPGATKCKYCRSVLLDPTTGSAGIRGNGGFQALATLARLIGGGSPVGGGGFFEDPGHDCWADCTDAYVACRTGGGAVDVCKRAFESCKKGCPPAGPQ
jgi:hypothetical protein